MKTNISPEDKNLISSKKTGVICSEDGLRLLKVLGDPEYVEVPEGVIVICDRSFSGLKNLYEVVLPASVTDLGRYAFAECSNLHKVVIPGVTDIMHHCFENDVNLIEIDFSATLHGIYDSAFNGCKSLSSIHIPEHLSIIDKFAFMHTGIKNLDISIAEGTNCNIYERAFAYCEQLVTVKLSKNTRIQERLTFAGCTSLREIEFESKNTCGSGSERTATMLLGCTSLERIILPKSKFNNPDFTIQDYDSCLFETLDLNRFIINI